MDEISLFYNENHLKYGIRQYVTWNPAVAPHFVVFGATGSGKTYAMKLMLARISKEIPDAQFFVADYKGDSDFSYLCGEQRFYRFMECENCLSEFFLRLQRRQSGEDTTKNFLLMFFDEWASYIMNLEKKKAEEEKRKLATLLMISRSYNMHVGIGQQRCDSAYFTAGSRDQYNLVMALGNLSSEGKDMMFREFKEQMKPDRKQGMGYMTINGTDFTPIQVPYITNMDKVNHYIKEAVRR